MPQLSPLSFCLPTKKTLESNTYHDVKGPKAFVDLLITSKNSNEIKSGFADLLAKGNYHKLSQHPPLWYRISSPKHSFSGFLCGLSTTVFQQAGVTTHEHVLDKRVELFSAYLEHTRLQAEPLLLLHEEDYFEVNFSTSITQRSPAYAFTINQNTHELWVLTSKEEAALHRFAKSQQQFHLADGHHRLASSLKHLDRQGKKYPIQSFIMAKNSIYKESFHWKIKQLLNYESFIEQLEKFPQKVKNPDVVVHTKHKTYALACDPSVNPADFIFHQVLKFSETSHNDLKTIIDYSPQVDFQTGPLKVEDPYRAIIAFRPLRWNEILSTAKEGKRLPPKSTYLLPKLPTGLLVSPI